MTWSRAALLINASGPDRVERKSGTLPVRATWATKMRTASGNDVPNSWVTFAARLSSFGSTLHRKSTLMLQMCHEGTEGRKPFLVKSRDWQGRFMIGAGTARAMLLLTAAWRGAAEYSGSKFPALAILAGQVFVGLGQVGDFHIGGVEEEPASFEAQGDGAQVEGIGDGSGQEEIAVGGFAAFESGDPGGGVPALVALPGRGFRQVFGCAVFAHFPVRDDAGILAVEAADKAPKFFQVYFVFLFRRAGSPSVGRQLRAADCTRTPLRSVRFWVWKRDRRLLIISSYTGAFRFGSAIVSSNAND